MVTRRGQRQYESEKESIRRPPRSVLPRVKDHLRPYKFVFLALTVFMLAIIAKLMYIQLWDAPKLKRQAQISRLQTVALYNRGRILDRKGVILAQDTILYDLFAHPQYYWKATPQQIADVLAPILKMAVPDLALKLAEPDLSTIGVAKNLHKSIVEKIHQARLVMKAVDAKTKQVITDDEGHVVTHRVALPGLDFNKKVVRNYPQGSLAAHILGYVNDEAGISSGVEDYAKAWLREPPADFRRPEINGRGDFIHVEQFTPRMLTQTLDAQDLSLTIDARLQYVAERELALGLEKNKAKRGTVIMMDPRTGELLAFAVLPTYEPERYFQAQPEALKNWAISDVYPPGSTMKILTVASGLETGVINRHSHLLDTGRMTIGGWTIQNYDFKKRGAPGEIDLVSLLQHSSNIGSAKISMMMKPEEHRELLHLFGFGQKAGLETPGESAGILLPLSGWDQTTHATIGFGYGLAATPLQMASAVASIANGGVWNPPHIIKSDKKYPSHRVISKATAKTITEILVESIQTAKTSTVRLEGINVAGKTGTSRKPKENGRGYDSSVFTSFVGFFPAEAPKVLIMVVVDSPAVGEAWGSTVAGPIFKAIAEETVSYLGLKADRIATLARENSVKNLTESRRQ